jgi:dTMP kinase
MDGNCSENQVSDGPLATPPLGKAKTHMFVVFEGSEGCGKTTQLELLRARLSRNGVEALVTREPGGTPLSESLRNIFKHPWAAAESPLPLTELYMVMAARSQHVATRIQPWLAEKRWILCDRFLDSSFVYQGHLGGLGSQVVQNIGRLAVDGVCPNITFVLDLPVEVALERMRKRGNVASDRYDSADRERLKTLREGFLELVKLKTPYPNGQIPRRVLIDASRETAEVHAQIWQHITL